MKLLRGSERDLKLDISGIDHSALNMEQNGDDRAESMPVITPQPAIKVSYLKINTSRHNLDMSITKYE